MNRTNKRLNLILRKVWALGILLIPTTWQPSFAEPLKIGFLAPYVGVYAKIGTDMDKGFKLFLEEKNNRFGPRRVSLVTDDTEGKPEMGLTKARRLVEKDQVSVLSGIIHSGVAYSIKDYVNTNRIPLVITNAGAARLTADDRSPYIFRVSFANGQQDRAGGWYARAKRGIRRMIIMAPDYSAGHEKATGFMTTFKAAGGRVVDEIYPPLGTQDFAPFLARVIARAGKVDAVWAFFAGSDAIRFVIQYSEFGLKAKVPLYILGDTVDDSLLPSMGQAAVGVVNYLHYAPSLDSPENGKFVTAYRKKYNEEPSMYSEQGYVGARVIAEATRAVNGKIENQAAFLSAMGKVQFEAPRGPFQFDKFQNVILPVYIRKVEQRGNRLENVIFDRVPSVDQFWTPK